MPRLTLGRSTDQIEMTMPANDSAIDAAGHSTHRRSDTIQIRYDMNACRMTPVTPMRMMLD
jgi:hypothetical protein